MLSTTNLTALFHDMVRAAMAAQQVASSETTEFYLVQLLEAFARPARGNLLDPPLALDYLEALHLGDVLDHRTLHVERQWKTSPRSLFTIVVARNAKAVPAARWAPRRPTRRSEAALA